MEEQLQRIFNIEKIYVKDLSLEISDAPLVFLESEAPKIDMQLHIDDAKGCQYGCKYLIGMNTAGFEILSATVPGNDTFRQGIGMTTLGDVYFVIYQTGQLVIH